MLASCGPSQFLVLSALLFVIGAMGALMRRNALVVLMCIEMMLNAGNLAFLAYAHALGDNSGHAITFFIMAIAAAEAAVGLAIVLSAFRSRESVNLDDFDVLRDQV